MKYTIIDVIQDEEDPIYVDNIKTIRMKRIVVMSKK